MNVYVNTISFTLQLYGVTGIAEAALNREELIGLVTQQVETEVGMATLCYILVNVSLVVILVYAKPMPVVFGRNPLNFLN